MCKQIVSDSKEFCCGFIRVMSQEYLVLIAMIRGYVNCMGSNYVIVFIFWCYFLYI